MHINNFYKYSQFKNKFTTKNREPFFNYVIECCGKLSVDDPIIVDIGSGEGELFKYLKDNKISTQNLFLLDSNPKSVENNQANFTDKSMIYTAPNALPFDGNSVDIIHTSHLIEYLNPNELYELMKEMHRVLKNSGYIVISAPLLWDSFYDDLGHVRPYNPMTFYKYFINLYTNSRLNKVSDSYEIYDLVYRYSRASLDEGWSSLNPKMDYIIIGFRRLIGKIGIVKLKKNGFTLILRKRTASN